MLHHLIAMTIAYFLDWVVGDPINWPHPVKWMGSLISQLEHRWNQGQLRKLKGLTMLITVIFIVAATTFVFTYFSYQIHIAIGIIVESIFIWSTIAERSLKEAAMTVYEPLQQKNLATARHKLSYIVGRDTDQLEEDGITRATIETVAENTSDGVTAPLFWALLGGAPLAMMYRAVNTCDSMVGYKNERFAEFGWASARFDDLLNFIPARITALCMIFSNRPVFKGRKQALDLLFRDAKKHPSPNSGWGEAAVAALLGIQLGGINYYKGIRSDRAKMGEPYVKLEAHHILAANQILTRTVITFLILSWIGGTVIEVASSWF